MGKVFNFFTTTADSAFNTTGINGVFGGARLISGVGTDSQCIIYSNTQASGTILSVLRAPANETDEDQMGERHMSNAFYVDLTGTGARAIVLFQGN